MSPAPGEIYNLSVNWNGCTDRRFCVVLDHPLRGYFAVVLLSGNMDYYDENNAQHFVIRFGEDFESGKLRECFADGSQIDQFHVDDIEGQKPSGRIKGRLLEELKDWIG
jgi:hypothetical protein